MNIRFLAVASLALLIAACSSKEPAPMSQAAPVDSVVPSSAPAVDSARIRHEREIRSEYADLIRKDSIADAPAVREIALGLNAERAWTGRSFCQRYERTHRWARLRNDLASSPALATWLQISREEVRRHYIANVKAIAPMLLSQEGKRSSEFLDNYYIYSECDGEMLDVMEKVMSWVLDSGLEPATLGLTRQAVRAKAAGIFAREVRGALKQGDYGLVNCHCESSIPFYFDEYKFTRRELGFTEKEWSLTLNDSTKKS
ncbi:hypothetical protein KW800_01035 [Candidatus Parcubacteria bacterium]|nr:hypothetical protein [Candidatus Parcubacteria bacterium]